MTDIHMISRGEGDYALVGELTFLTADAALAAVGQLFGKGRDLRFDLTNIRRADSAGVALLIEWMRRARTAGGSLRYAHLPRVLRAIIRVSGVEELLPVESTETAAPLSTPTVTVSAADMAARMAALAADRLPEAGPLEV